MFQYILALTWVFVLTGSTFADDWPQFRGSTAQGHSSETNLPIEFGPDRNVAWKIEVPGSGWSSPIVLGSRVILTAAVPREDDEEGESLRVYCFDARDGEVLWNKDVFQQPPSRIHQKNTHASPTPLGDGQRIFVHFGTHGTACLNLDGQVVWKTKELDYAPVHGNGGSPVLVDDLLFVSCDGGDGAFVAALDAATGKIRWKKARPAVENPRTFAFTTPLVIEVNGAKQIVSPGANVAIAYEPKTGKEIWQVGYEGYSVVPRPVFGHGLVFICTGFNSPSLLAIRPDGTGEVTDTHVEWSTRRGVPHTPSTLLIGDELYFISDRGVMNCVDARTGESHWSQRIGGKYSASPLYADGRIYVQSEEGESIVVKPGLEYSEVARNRFPGERTLASYAVSDSAFFIRTDKHLYRIQRP